MKNFLWNHLFKSSLVIHKGDSINWVLVARHPNFEADQSDESRPFESLVPLNYHGQTKNVNVI